MGPKPLYGEVMAVVTEFMSGVPDVPAERREGLDKLVSLLRARRDVGEPIDLVFICTHNSRRSHVAQIWAQTAAYFHGMETVRTWSGGTEATAFAPPAIASVHRHGFRVEKEAGRDNPHVLVRYAPDAPLLDCWSKVYDDPANPRSGFIAVMVCSSADEACPFVAGAAERVSLPYRDPKESDGSEREAAVYDERVREIGREVFSVFARVVGG